MSRVLFVAAVCCFAALAGPTPAPAALPTDALEKMQADAPEQLDVLVQSVHTHPAKDRDFLHVDLKARVRAIRRSAAGLKVGDVVSATWQVPAPGVDFAGDWAEPPRKSRTYRAYLQGAGKAFRPAAASASFEPIPPAAA